MINHIQTSVRQIDEINRELGLENETTESLPWSASIQMETSAYPENRYKVDAADIANLQREQAEATKRSRDEGGDMNITGGFGGNETEDGGSKAAPPAQPASVVSQPSVGASAGNDLPSSVRDSATGAPTDLSPLELHELDIRRRTLQYRKSRIIKVKRLKLVMKRVCSLCSTNGQSSCSGTVHAKYLTYDIAFSPTER